MDAEKLAKKKAAAEAKKAAQEKLQAEKATKDKARKEKQAEVAKPYVGKDIGLKPITAPALPISATKEEKLQALLTKYKADQISPEEYHRQRAAIIAEP